MIEPFARDLEGELRHAAVRARVRALRSDCGLLGASLPGTEPWRGVASGAYRLRVLQLRGRLSAALAAIDAAEGML